LGGALSELQSASGALQGAGAAHGAHRKACREGTMTFSRKPFTTHDVQRPYQEEM
jgi:hypothetical protein